MKFFNELFGIDSNTSATILITIAIFLLGYLLQWIIAQIYAVQKRKRVRSLFKLSMIEFFDQVKKQSESYMETLAFFTIENSEPFEFKRATIFPIHSIDELGYSSTYKAFFTGIENIFMSNQNASLRAFNNIWKAVYDIDFWHKLSFERADDFLTKYRDINNKRIAAIEEYMKLYTGVLSEVHGSRVPAQIAQYIEEIDNIHVEWEGIENRKRPDVIHINLIEKLIEANKKHRDVILSSQFRTSLLKAEFEYQNQCNFLDIQTNQFSIYADLFTSSYKNGLEGLKKLS